MKRSHSAIENPEPLDELLESPSIGQRIGYLLANPWKNFLLPAAWLKRAVSGSPSPLIAESRRRPGGWRSMEIIYRNAEPVDWFDRQALRDNPISMAARNRCRIATRLLASMIAEYGAVGSVSLVGVGAGPGRHIQHAIARSGVDPARIQAWLIDLDGDAFAWGRALADRLGIARCIHFVEGDARRIRDVLPDVAPQIVKLIGLAEYLSDVELVALLSTLRGAMATEGRLLTHGLLDPHGGSRFLARVFGLRHRRRSARQMETLLQSAGFRPVECVTEPVGVYPIITAVRDDRPRPHFAGRSLRARRGAPAPADRSSSPR